MRCRLPQFCDMITKLLKLFGQGSKTDYSKLLNEGALIIDVRTKGEFASGHIRGSMNIPVDALKHNLSKLKNREIPIITCCASGMRSGVAKNFLLSNGYKQVYNGGSWASLQRKLSK